MFRDVITVKWKDSYTAKKIPLSKEISNVSNSYQIRIQAYELEQKIDGETVFILQLKHNRNVRNVASTHSSHSHAHAPIIGISMHNQYRMTPIINIKHKQTNDTQQQHNNKCILQHTRKRSSSSFFDQIWLQHKSKSILHATINTIFRAFDCDDFIQYNEHANQFVFNFDAKPNMTQLTKYVSLSRTKYTEQEAETRLKDRHHEFEKIKPCKVQVCCVNAHEIEDKDWDFEVNLTLLPGRYQFYINELFGKVATQIHARDYPQIRQFYSKQLKQFVSDRNIFDEYLRHLSTFEPRYKMMEWSKNGVESGPLFGLYSILCQIDSDDDIWNNLFEICLRDKIEDEVIRHTISEQTVADFIALSLKHYVKDSVKRRIQLIENDLNNKNNSSSSNNKKKEESDYILSESDRYILSIILPYFGSPALKSIHKSVAKESLPSGLFNHFCDSIEAQDEDKWCMKVEPLQLKNKLLTHLYKKGYDVVKQYYLAVYQYTPAVEKTDKSQWTFYIRPSTYAEIFNNTHKINMNAYTFYDKFEFQQRSMPNVAYLNLIIKCVDVSFECDWAMWTRRKLKKFKPSLGYWKILNTSDERPRVPVDHLDAILALLRHDAMSISPKLLRNEKQLLSVVFLKDNNSNNKWSEDKIDAEYQLTWWNGRKTGNSSISLRLLKSDYLTDKNRKSLKERDSYFVHYRSKDANIKWLWYDNDLAKHREYDLGPTIPKQLEATYLGVSETMFPLDQFKREKKSNIKEHIFNCASMPEMTFALQKKTRSKAKPFVLRFAFDRYDRDKIRNIEQLAINNYYDQFPRSVSRVYSGKYGLRINNEDRRVSSLGEMTIYQSNKSIIICWKFKKNPELSLFKTYHYKVQIPIKYENKFQRLLVHWRRDTLFGQTMANRALCIQQSRMWKNDRKMPPVKEVTVEYNEEKKEDDYDSEFGANGYDDDDDDKDEEKQSKNSKKSKKEECIPCQMIASNDEEEIRRRELADNMDADSDENEDNIDITQRVTEAEWDKLDLLDDKQRESRIFIMKQNPDYDKSFVPQAESVFDLWIKSHKPQKFRKTLYRLVSLTYVQSIISVMKHHAKKKKLMIVISNMQNIYSDLFNLLPSDYIATNSKLLSYLFDGLGDIKRIDSKGNIYSISLGDNLPHTEYLHEFIRMTSKKYKQTLVLFTRENSDNLYISHAGFLSKLSLNLHDEDLHYFLPLFIPLKIGDCVNIEAFSSPDSGTIVSLWRNTEKNNIVYRIRSTQNVYYIMNYYQLVNRAAPKTYWYDIRKNFVADSSIWNDVKLWKTEKSAKDPSDGKHPLHGVILALVESSKQAIASIESQLSMMMNERRSGKKKKFEEGKQFAIQHKLQNTGAIFLFYKTVQIEDKSEQILEFEREMKENSEINDDDEGEKSKNSNNNNNNNADEFNSDEDDETDLRESNPQGLNHLIKFLKRNKLISNVLEYSAAQRTSYDLFCSLAADIFHLNASNRVFVCHMIETKKYVLEECDDGNGANPEEAISISNNNNNNTTNGATTAEEIISNNNNNNNEEDAFNYMNDDEDDEWLTLEPDADDILRSAEDSAEAKQRVVIKSSFECELKVSFEISCVAEQVLTVEELMVMMKEKKKWSTEDHKLLTQFHAHNIYNKFDLLDKKLIKKLKLKLFGSQTANNSSQTKSDKIDKNLALLEKKFIEFTECVEQLLVDASIESPLTQYVIAGVEVTRNARLLQGYIDKFRRYKADSSDLTNTDLEIISSNTDHTMIVSYNPIQTVVVTSTMIKDVTHPIHLYRAAYDEKFYPRNQIIDLHAEWMQTQTRCGNIIKSISALLRYNKKYEIILVPSSVHLSSEKFLKPRCSMVAPEHEAIADYRITFLYKGLLYRYDRKKAKAFFEKYKKYSCMVSDADANNIGADDLDDERDDNKVYTDEIKFLLRVLHNNISEEQPDAMDPAVASHDDIFTDEIKEMITIDDNAKYSDNIYIDADTPETPDDPLTKFRLRASIKRKHTDRIFRWLNIGTGACHLHETGAHSKEIGPKQGTDFEREFPRILQRAMFLYYIDCRVPFNEDIISQDSQCAICKQLMIDPATIGHKDCQHIFCKLCIQQWYFVNYQQNHNNLNINQNHNHENNKKCPVCRRKIEKISVSQEFVEQMKRGIPTTIYQQIMDDNQSRFLRQYLLDSFLTERERVLEAEYSQQQQQQAPQSQNLQQQMQNNVALQLRLAGH